MQPISRIITREPRLEISDGKTEKSTQRFAQTITEEKTAHQQPTKRVVNKISATYVADFYLASGLPRKSIMEMRHNPPEGQLRRVLV